MARLQHFFILGTTLSLLYGCGKVIGLDNYEIDDSLADGDGHGDGDGDGDTGGTGGRDGSGGSMSMGGMGSGGLPAECGGVDCDDDNECTDETCIDDECGSVTVDAGQPCAGGVCNGTSGNPRCVRCIDDASGSRRDSGCQASAPLCDTSGTATCVECLNHADCDDGNACTTDTCDSGSCEHEEAAVGSPCPSGVCGGDPSEIECVHCIDDESGDNQDTGCTAGAPRCEGSTDPTCTGCDSDDDCDDTNDCTTESCNGASQCVYNSLDAGTTCDGGVCDAGASAGECVACIDNNSAGNQDSGCALAQPVCDTNGDNTCRICIDDAPVSGVDSGCTAGMPACDTSAGNSCVPCIDDAAPGNQDSGCSPSSPFCDTGSCVECEGNGDCGGSTPVCDGGTCVECASDSNCGGSTPRCNNAGTCVECLNAGHCGDGVACTVDSCSGGTCTNTANDNNCPDSGDACNPNVCNAVSGCQASPITPTNVELVQNGNFEQGDTNWNEYSEQGYVLIDTLIHFGAQSGNQAAWLCGTDDEFSDIYQWITIPTDATEFTISGYYRIHFENDLDDGNTPDADDYFIGRFYDINDDPLGDPVTDRYLDLDGSMENNSWVYFTKTYTNVSSFLPGQQIQLDFLCQTDQNGGDTAFYVDSVSVTAKICQP